MAIVQFNHLTKEESDLLLHAPALVTCLIAGADNNMNVEEEEKSKHLVRIRANSGDPILFDYYREVEIGFDEQLNTLDSKYGGLQAPARAEIIIGELAKLNDILPKLDDLYVRSYLKSLRSLAQAVAEASGGILGFLTVTYEEKHLINLEMITYKV